MDVRSGDRVLHDGQQGIVVGFDADRAQVVYDGAERAMRVVRFPDGSDKLVPTGAVSFVLVDPSELEKVS